MNELVQKYSMYMDAGEFDRMAEIFAEDAVFDLKPDPGMFPLPVRGRTAICETLAKRFGALSEVVQRRHITSVFVVDEQTQDTASARSFMTVTSAAKKSGMVTLHASGIYHDRFVRREGRWQILERVMVADAPVKAKIE